MSNISVCMVWERYRLADPRTLAEAVYAAGFGSGGFGSYAQFYMVFTQVYGCGPRACLGPAVSSMDWDRSSSEPGICLARHHVLQEIFDA